MDSFVFLALLGSAAKAAPSKPHIIMMLVDDLGYNAPGYRNPDLITPALDSLAESGVVLEEYYVYQYCAPTRGAFHTGRFPYHLDAVQHNLIPWSMPAGIDLRYKFLPALLKSAGYSTHHIGKWHQGFFDAAYTPLHRGYDTSYGFLVGGEDHYSQDASWSVNCSTRSVDLSRNGSPCFGQTGDGKVLDDAKYNGFRFTAEAVEIIMNHTVSTPMFMYFAVHNTHSPIEAPARIQAKYERFEFTKQKVFNAMVTTVDETARNVTDALKSTGMWNTTVFVWSTDNGSPVTVAGTNAPLRGGKGSNWEVNLSWAPTRHSLFLTRERALLTTATHVHVHVFASHIFRSLLLTSDLLNRGVVGYPPLWQAAHCQQASAGSGTTSESRT